MSLLEYAKDKNMDIVTMNNLIEKFKTKNDNIELIQLLEFMAEKINLLMKQNSKKTTPSTPYHKTTIVKEQEGFKIDSFRITTDKLYLMIGKNEALEYEFQKDDISKCFEIISSERINKTDVGTVFKRVAL
jgi:hypothetical protein